MISLVATVLIKLFVGASNHLTLVPATAPTLYGGQRISENPRITLKTIYSVAGNTILSIEVAQFVLETYFTATLTVLAQLSSCVATASHDATLDMVWENKTSSVLLLLRLVEVD